MIRTIEAHVADTWRETGRGQLAPKVLKAVTDVPRERFVPATSRHLATRDGPLPIGHGQTISQPFIVALMTDLLDPESRHRVLEVGTGCGYQTAILAKLVEAVFSIEIVGALAEQAQTTLQNLGYDNVQIRLGDGRIGWPEQAPFDGILVAAAGRGVPQALKQQLKIGGHLVLPVESAMGQQTLQRITRQSETAFLAEDVLGVRFVPLVDREVYSNP